VILYQPNSSSTSNAESVQNLDQPSSGKELRGVDVRSKFMQLNPRWHSALETDIAAMAENKGFKSSSAIVHWVSTNDRNEQH